jgi:transcriptional regulator with GAF, ATPase, and Fis domain
MPARLTAYLPDVAATCLVRSPAPLSLGRGEDCGFRIDHPSVSRAHAVLAQGDGGWQLRDAGSKNGSFVDEVRVDTADLGAHAWFRLGDIVCELATLSEQAADQAEVRLVEKRANSRFLAQALERQSSLSGVLAQTVSAVVELADCDRGFLLLAGEDGLTVVDSKGLDRGVLLSREFRGSIGAVERAIASSQPVVVNDAMADARLSGRQSVLAGGLRTLVALPLVAGNDFLGVVYADSTRVGALITGMDLELLAAFAERAALWIAARRGLDALSRLTPSRTAWSEIVQAQQLASA